MSTVPSPLRKGLFAILVALATPGLASAQTPAGQKTAPGNQKGQTTAEKYEPLQNPSELGLDVEVAASFVSFGNSAGGQVSGKITSFSIGGKQLELTNAEIEQDANGSWINTKAYGRIKIASGALGRGLVISLTASQKESLRKLYQATKSSVGASGAAAPPRPDAPKRIRVSMAVQEAKIINRVEPEYPPLARTARIQGTVRLHAIIGKDGTVQELEVVSGHPLLVAAAQSAVKQWTYKPTLLMEQPVEVETFIDVIFTLGGAPKPTP